METTERRQWARVNATYEITYECFNARGAKIHAGDARTVDISGRGALIEMSRGVDLDDSLILWIKSPFTLLLVKGNVVHARLSSNGSWHVGVKMTDMIEGSWEALEKIVRERMEEEAL